ncbi:aspartate/glutamate racemase family protein, partial [Streptomyces sp. NPDC056730]|uniref:aspartate/glutamate racemase family protein n=1 Tax=Streptomyces sp. NPDC056730 TaxID=3345929 RepID=UPI0036B2E04F
ADHPGLVLRHLVDESLLSRARAEGPEAVAAEVASVLAGAVAEGATAALCTCSTIGEVAERAAPAVGVPVLRVDRPMAVAAAAADRVVVVAALDGTLDATAALIRQEAGERRIEIRTVLVEGAWERFEAGDRDGYLNAVAAAVDAVTEADVIVLAQASMADAAERAASGIPVFSSPRPGLNAAAAAAVAI